MWLKSQILLLYCIASEVWMAKQLNSRRNLPQGLYSVEDHGSAGWDRLKRSLYQGKSCRIRGCCTGRNDDCSFNIASRAAICYCDQFCATGPPGPVDCCADYWDVCDNTVEPTRSDEPWPPPTSGGYREKTQLVLVYHKKNIVGSKITDRSLECVHPKNVPIDIVDKYIVYKAEIRIMLPVISLLLGIHFQSWLNLISVGQNLCFTCNFSRDNLISLKLM